MFAIHKIEAYRNNRFIKVIENYLFLFKIFCHICDTKFKYDSRADLLPSGIYNTSYRTWLDKTSIRRNTCVRYKQQEKFVSRNYKNFLHFLKITCLAYLSISNISISQMMLHQNI